MRYLILQNPGHNRVYYKSADKLALAELSIACKEMNCVCSDVSIKEIENIRYLSFTTDDNLSQIDIDIISRLSFVFALFCEEKVNEDVLLKPLCKLNYEYLDQKISSILKYQGKTNELFTKMMLNVALLSSDFNYHENLTMLDPVAGKGTTLFEALVYGFNAYGIEKENKSVHELKVFFKKYLEQERYKHSFSDRKIYGTSKSDFKDILEFDFAKSKEEFKSDDNKKKLGVVCGDSQDAYKYFKKEIFHLIVGDLPYGIYHGNKSGQSQKSITRNPAEFLAESLQEWYKVLKKGGVVVVAWK